MFPPHQQKLIFMSPKLEQTSSDVSCDDVIHHVRIKVVNGNYKCWIGCIKSNKTRWFMIDLNFFLIAPIRP